MPFPGSSTGREQFRAISPGPCSFAPDSPSTDRTLGIMGFSTDSTQAATRSTGQRAGLERPVAHPGDVQGGGRGRHDCHAESRGDERHESRGLLDLVANAGNESRVGAGRRHHGAHHRTASARMGDEVLVAQVGDGQALSVGQSVAGGQSRKEPVLTHCLGGYPPFEHGRAKQRQVNGSCDEGLQLSGRQHLAAHADVDSGQHLTQRPHELWEQRVGGRSDTSDRQPALGAVGDAASLFGGVVDCIQDLDCPMRAYLPKLPGTGPAHPCRHCFCQLSQTLSGPRGGCEMLIASRPFDVSAGRFRLFRVVSRAQIQRFRRSRCFMQRVRFPAVPCHSSFEPGR